ncbi:hypothetical protein PMAYCL1PPCAC_19945, partial [Pristionchus mayeri]
GLGLLLLVLLSCLVAATICSSKSERFPHPSSKGRTSRTSNSQRPSPDRSLRPRRTPTPTSTPTPPVPPAASPNLPRPPPQSPRPPPPPPKENLKTAIDVIEDIVEAKYPSDVKTEGVEQLREEYRKELYREREEEKNMTSGALRSKMMKKRNREDSSESVEEEEEATVELFKKMGKKK